jgi:hypothetical protein
LVKRLEKRYGHKATVRKADEITQRDETAQTKCRPAAARPARTAKTTCSYSNAGNSGSALPLGLPSRPAFLACP